MQPISIKREIAQESLGPAMQKLTPMQRAFVRAFLDNGGRNQTQAALDAGYSNASEGAKVVGHHLAHNPKIQEAMLEVSKQRIRTSGVAAVSYLAECVTNDGLPPRDRMKAALALMDRQGLHAFTEHKTTVEHTMDEADMITKIERLSEKLGIDPKKLLGSTAPKALPVIDVTPTEVDLGMQGLEDIL